MAIEKGLNACKSTAVYQQLLRRFVRDYANSAKGIAHLESTEAKALVHKLKGVAGNLALTEITEKARELEQVLNNKEDPSICLQRLQIAMDLTLRSIEMYLPVVINSANIQPQTFDPTLLKLLLGRMLKALDSDSPATIRVVLDELSNMLPATCLVELTQTIENFDFRGGEVATSKLIDKYFPGEVIENAKRPYSDR